MEYKEEAFDKVPFYMTYPMQNLYETEMEYEKDLERMKELYPREVREILAIIEKRCDELDYEGSRIFDENPDRQMMDEEVCRLYQQLKDKGYEDVRMPEEEAVPPERPQMNPVPVPENRPQMDANPLPAPEQMPQNPQEVPRNPQLTWRIDPMPMPELPPRREGMPAPRSGEMPEGLTAQEAKRFPLFPPEGFYLPGEEKPLEAQEAVENAVEELQEQKNRAELTAQSRRPCRGWLCNMVGVLFQDEVYRRRCRHRRCRRWW